MTEDGFRDNSSQRRTMPPAIGRIQARCRAWRKPRSTGRSTFRRCSMIGAAQPFDADLARPELLHEFFERQADARSDSIAVECGTSKLTYGELECLRIGWRICFAVRASGMVLAWHLLLPRVRMSMWRCWPCSKPGQPTCRSIPGYPPDRVAYILENCHVHTLLSTTRIGRRAAGVRRARIESRRAVAQNSRCIAAKIVARGKRRHIRRMWPTSSIHRARPADRKGSRSSTAA